MPKNTKGGKGHKKGKNKVSAGGDRKLLLKDGPAQEYALVSKALGDRRFQLLCTNEKVLLGHVRGKMRKRQWVRPGDLVLFTYRDTSDGKVDITHKYNEEQAKQVKKVEGLVFKNEDDKEDLSGAGLGAKKIVFDAIEESDNENSSLDEEEDDEEEYDDEEEEDDDEEEEEDDDEEMPSREQFKRQLKQEKTWSKPNQAATALSGNQTIDIDDL
jgi:translation initiation factor 1A